MSARRYTMDQIRAEDPSAFSMDEVARLLREEHGLANAYVEQTGGGCATIYAGPTWREEGWGIRYAVVAGPGSYGWGAGPSVGYRGDFYWGPDDDGEEDPVSLPEQDPADEAEIARRIAAWLSARS